MSMISLKFIIRLINYCCVQSEDGRLRIYQCDFLTLSNDVVDLKFDAGQSE